MSLLFLPGALPGGELPDYLGRLVTGSSWLLLYLPFALLATGLLVLRRHRVPPAVGGLNLAHLGCLVLAVLDLDQLGWVLGWLAVGLAGVTAVLLMEAHRWYRPQPRANARPRWRFMRPASGQVVSQAA